MDLWQWVLVYAVLLTALQLLVYAYVRRDDDDRSVALATDGDRNRSERPVPGRSTYPQLPAADDDGGATGDEDGRHHVEGEDTLRCPHCGTRNERDPAYTYCRNCVSQLGM